MDPWGCCDYLELLTRRGAATEKGDPVGIYGGDIPTTIAPTGTIKNDDSVSLTSSFDAFDSSTTSDDNCFSSISLEDGLLP